jgi:hypothetical protein
MQIDTAVQEQFDELREAIHGLRRTLVTANGSGNPHPAPATSPAGDAAILDALHELTDEVRKMRTNGVITEGDAERIATSIDNHLAVLEEELDDEEEPTRASKKGSAKSGNAGAATKRGNADVDEEESVRRRPGYFGAKD